MAEKNVLTISELITRAKADGYPLSGYAIRRAIKTGALPCRRVGKKYLVCWDVFVKWIRCEDGGDITPIPQPVEPPRPAMPSFEPARGIRRIAAGR